MMTRMRVQPLIGDRPHHNLHHLRRGVPEVERDLSRVADGERFLHVKQHDVQAAGAKRHNLVRGQGDALDRRHLHHAVRLRRVVQFGAAGPARCHRGQRVVLARLVGDGEVAGGHVLRRGAHERVLDREGLRPGLVACGQRQAGEGQAGEGQRQGKEQGSARMCHGSRINPPGAMARCGRLA